MPAPLRRRTQRGPNASAERHRMGQTAMPDLLWVPGLADRQAHRHRTPTFLKFMALCMWRRHGWQVGVPFTSWSNSKACEAVDVAAAE